MSVRDLHEDVAGRPKVRAARDGRLMDAGVRVIFTDAAIADDDWWPSLAQAIQE